MSLAEMLSKEPPPPPNNPCLFCVALDQMEDRDREAAIDAAYGRTWSDRELLERLHKAGFETVKKSSIANHRQNDHSNRRSA